MPINLDYLSKPKDVQENGEMWYTTTFHIPKWLGEYLKDEAEDQGLRGANRVVVVACTNYLLSKEERERHNAKVQEIFDRGSITEKERAQLWR